MFLEIDVKGTLSNAQLWEACTTLVGVYPILRTAFITHSQLMMQVVLKELVWEQKIKEFTANGDLDKVTAEIIAAKKSEVLKPITTEFFLIRDRSREDFKRFVINWNHAQYDGLSFPTLIRDLQNAYHGTPVASVPSFNCSFTRFVAYTDTTSYQAECEEFWCHVLDGSFPTEIVPRQHCNTFPPTANTRLSRSVEISPTRKFTMATIVKSAWALSLAELTEKQDIIFAQVVSGRDIAMDNIDGIIGPCIDYCPVRINTGNKTKSEILRIIQNPHIDMLPYEAMGLSQIVKKCTSWNDSSTFPANIQLQNLDQLVDEFDFGDGLDCKLRASSKFVGSADIFVFLHILKSGFLELVLSYSDDLIKGSIAENLLGLLVQNIKSLDGVF